MDPAAPAAPARAKGASRRGGYHASVPKRSRAEPADAAQAEEGMAGDEDSQGASGEVGSTPHPWYDLGVAFATEFEVTLVVLALVYYAADMPGGKGRLLEYCKGVEDDSKGTYHGHGQPWTSPEAWRRDRRSQVPSART